ncbi:MAG: hypothetical protein QME79_12470 [Bacillota bacterium]|nr:hypothetical protein [Bacillota bacterium]
MGVAGTIIVYLYVEAKQPAILAELRRRRLLRRAPGPRPVAAILVDGRPYVDLTERVTEAATGYRPEMDHAAYRRIHGRLRQVRQVESA